MDPTTSNQPMKYTRSKERFLMFVRVLMKYLQQKNKPMHNQAKAIIRECAERKKQKDPEYSSLSTSIARRLKELVRLHYWRKAEYYLCQFLMHQYSKNKLKKQSKMATPPALAYAIHLASKLENESHWNAFYKPLIYDVYTQYIICQDNGISVSSSTTSSSPAITPNQDGRYLLHIASEEGLPWYGIQDIWMENVHAIHTCDYQQMSGLLPFMLASVGDRDDDDDDGGETPICSSSNLSCAFELLRSRPDVLEVLSDSTLSSLSLMSSSSSSLSYLESKQIDLNVTSNSNGNDIGIVVGKKRKRLS